MPIPTAGWLKGGDENTALTVVYSDSDDGLRQKRLIATSTIERGQWLSLGQVRDIDPTTRHLRDQREGAADQQAAAAETNDVMAVP